VPKPTLVVPEHHQPPAWLVGTVIGYFATAALGLGLLMLHMPQRDGVLTQDEFIELRSSLLFLYTCGMMICCGTIGGSLYDIRGLIMHSTHNDFDPLCTLSYLLRPIAGGLSSLIAFFLLLVGALGFSYSHDPVGGAGWTSFDGRLPYLAVGFLAGYSSQVFMLKLKEIADAAFSSGARENGNGNGNGNGHGHGHVPASDAKGPRKAA
jgi:hypothetical protein